MNRDPLARVPLLFDAPFAVIGMIHLLPLPGAPGWGGSMAAVEDRAGRDAEALAAGGADAVLVENYHDVPFHPGALPAETVAALAALTRLVRGAVSLPVGVNALRNDARAALGVAAATGAGFIRVNVHTGTMLTDQGTLEGRAHETLRVRAALGVEVAILADVLVKHAVPPHGLSVERAAADAWERGRADALVVSGEATGAATDTESLRAARAAVPEAPLLVGSGLGPENAAALLPLADGAIVGSALQRDGRAGGPVEADRVRRLVEVVRAVRA
ncbi:MAG: BtpA/SgcQ family protein [Gemmatimonadota bacterium]